MQEKTLKDKVKRDHKISVLQKRLKASAMEIDVLKKRFDHQDGAVPHFTYKDIDALVTQLVKQPVKQP